MIGTETFQEQHEEIAEQYQDKILDNLPEQKILVQGVTLDFSLPSEGKLRLHGIRKTGHEDIKEEVTISVAPEKYKNKFKNLRRKFYTKLSETAFILGKGEGNRNLYLIPLENVPQFMNSVNELKEDFRELETEINQYLRNQTTGEEQEFLENVREYIQEQSEVFHGLNLNYTVECFFDVSLMPLRIDTATFKEIASDQVTQEMEKSLEQLKVEFARTRKKIIERMIADLNLRFSGILQKLAKAAETSYAPRYETIKESVDQTVALAKSVNLDWLIRDLAQAVEATASVVSKKKIDEKELKKATSLIAKTLNLPRTDEPIEILKKATYNLQTCDERVKAVVARM